MEYRTLGNSGLVVSALCLGTMQFGDKMNLGNLDQKATTTMVNHAVDKGINFIDTADVYSYGESETLLGNAIQGKRDELVIATKARLPMSDNVLRSGATRRNLIQGVESSLKRLQTDYIDLFQMHSWDELTPIEETVLALDDLVKQGKIRYLGFSNYLAWQATTALHVQEKMNLNKFISAQMYYSLVGRGLENEFLSCAEYFNMGILVWSPLAGGFLSGKYTRHQDAPKESRFKDAGNFIPFERNQGFKIIKVLQKLAKRHDCSPAAVSIAWLLDKSIISSVIIAARTIEHLDQNIESIHVSLKETELAELDDVSAKSMPYPTWMHYQHNFAEDNRPKALYPELYEMGQPWGDQRETKWNQGK